MSRTRSFSARFPASLVELLDESARRVGVSRSQMAERYIQEGLLMEKYPGIQFRDGPAGRRPGVIRGPDVFQVIAVLKASPQRGEAAIDHTAEWLALELVQVRAALSYYADNSEEVDFWIERNDAMAEEAEAAWLREQAALD